MRSTTFAPLALAAGLALIAPPARAAAPVLEVRPPALLLCAKAAAVVTVSGAGGRPLLTASVGRLGPPREAGPDAWEADYTPPAACSPEVAVVSAVSPAGWAWATVPLSGQGDAVVKTSPRATISVRIGERSFGPATADRAGVALVPVIVPPGVHAARHGTREIPLELPPPRRVHAALARAVAPADREASVTVRVFAIEEDGRPADAARARLAVTAGAVTPPVAVAPGVAEATWTIPAGASGPQRLTAALPGDAGGAGLAVLERPAGEPARVEVRTEPVEGVAGAELRVLARVLDLAGNRSEAPAALSAPAGTVLRWEPSPEGWRGVVRAPERLPGSRTLAVEVRAGAASARREVALLAGAPVRIAVTPPAGVLADGRGPATVRVRVEDALGNAPAAAPEVSAELGKVSAPEPDGAGGWRVAYRAPELPHDGADRLRARLGEARGEAALRLLARPARLTLAVKAGPALRAGAASGAAAVELAWWPAALRGRGALALEAGWADFARTDRLDLGGAPAVVRGRADLAPLTLTALGQLRLGGAAIGWLGAGGGLALVRATGAVAGVERPAETGLAAEAHAGAGAGLRLGPGWLVLEAREAWVVEPSVTSLSGTLRIHSLCVGYRRVLR